jgi:formate dehydrogenase major subunit
MDTHCELQRIAAYVGIEQSRLERLRRPAFDAPVDDSNPFFTLDPNKCVLCGICVRTCEELRLVSAIDLGFRGYHTVISTFGNRPRVESNCESCGACVARCPVGALYPSDFRLPAREVQTTCVYCGVGCGLYLGVRGDKVVGVNADPDRATNKGALCVKGQFGYKFINHPERLTRPLIRKNDELVEATWDEALDLVAAKFSASKGDRFAALTSAKCTNEDNYVVQKFTRAVMETNNIDHCARL